MPLQPLVLLGVASTAAPARVKNQNTQNTATLTPHKGGYHGWVAPLYRSVFLGVEKCENRKIDPQKLPVFDFWADLGVFRPKSRKRG